jgi:CHAT domain-containing protein/Tfp pilus assembly protein PilF
VAALLPGPTGAGEKLSPAEEKRAQEARELQKKGLKLLREGKAAEAVDVAKQVLVIRRGVYKQDRFPRGQIELARALNDVGVALFSLGDLPGARPYYQEALVMRRLLFPKEDFPRGHVELAQSIHDLGILLVRAGDLPGARPYLEESLAMRRRLFPQKDFPGGHPDVAQGLNELGFLLSTMGDLPGAQPYYEQALAMKRLLYKERFPQGHLELAVSLNNLGALHSARGELAWARQYYEEALAMCQRLYPKKDFPRGHPAISRALNNLGILLKKEGEFASAGTYLEQALAMDEALCQERGTPQAYFDLARTLTSLGVLYYARGEPSRAQPYWERALKVYRRLYPPERFPRGHSDLATGLNNLGVLFEQRGEYAQAQRYDEEALAMFRRLYPEKDFPRGHSDLAASLTNLGFLHSSRGELAAARPYFEQALAMLERLYPEKDFPRGHPALAQAHRSLGQVLKMQGDYTGARLRHEKALAMQRRLSPEKDFPRGRSELARSIISLASLLSAQGQSARARPYFDEALTMLKGLYPEKDFPRGHPDLVASLTNLGTLLHDQGELARAEPPYREALAACRRLYPEKEFPQGHPDLARGLYRLGSLLQDRGDAAGARAYYEDALAMYQRLADSFAELAAEAETLNYLASLPAARDGYLVLTAGLPAGDAGAVYAHLWRSRGALLRTLARRRQMLSQVPDRATRDLLEDWLDTRRQLARLALTFAPAGSKAAADRQKLLDDCTRRKDKLERHLAGRLPALTRPSEQPGPEALRDRLPEGGAFLDLCRYRAYDAPRREWGDFRYAAFVVRPGRPVRRVELGDAGPIEAALRSWRQALQAQGRPPGGAPSALAAEAAAGKAAAEVRRLVWAPLTADLGGSRQVWLCPDGPLAALPWAALPGRKTGTVLLEEHTFTVVPHGPALLEWLQGPAPDAKGGRMLLVGGVDYGVPGKPWAKLPATQRECDHLAALTRELGQGLEVAPLGGADAGPERVLRELRGARLAHVATHGYFAAEDSKERGRLYERSDFNRMAWGERVGAVARNPLTLSGLVLAGANRGGGAGVLTAEALAGEDLRGLDLAVLSACQTGLGEAEAAEGVFGLQRALHLAGARSVVASLWRVDDEATAALMAVFYHKLWRERLAPAEALRQAQLALYSHPESIKVLAHERGPNFDREVVRAAPPRSAALPPPARGQRLPARYWAGFVLSGPGR